MCRGGAQAADTDFKLETLACRISDIADSDAAAGASSSCTTPSKKNSVTNFVMFFVMFSVIMMLVAGSVYLQAKQDSPAKGGSPAGARARLKRNLAPPHKVVGDKKEEEEVVEEEEVEEVVMVE